LERDLARVHTFWEELKRHEAKMPFWDDMKVSALPDLAGCLMMVEATDKPVRFRIAFGSSALTSSSITGTTCPANSSTRSMPLRRCNSWCRNAAPRWYYRNDSRRAAAMKGAPAACQGPAGAKLL
jgi:hypothetical protein